MHSIELIVDMKKIYLDIDGTLIHESSDKYGQLAVKEYRR